MIIEVPLNIVKDMAFSDKQDFNDNYFIYSRHPTKIEHEFSLVIIDKAQGKCFETFYSEYFVYGSDREMEYNTIERDGEQIVLFHRARNLKNFGLLC